MPYTLISKILTRYTKPKMFKYIKGMHSRLPIMMQIDSVHVCTMHAFRDIILLILFVKLVLRFNYAFKNS